MLKIEINITLLLNAIDNLMFISSLIRIRPASLCD